MKHYHLPYLKHTQSSTSTDQFLEVFKMARAESNCSPKKREVHVCTSTETFEQPEVITVSKENLLNLNDKLRA